MEIYPDLRVESVSVVVKKKENLSFHFQCKRRSFDGWVYVTAGKGVYEDAEGRMELTPGCLLLLEEGEAYSIRAVEDGFEYIATGCCILPRSHRRLMGLPRMAVLPPHLRRQMEKMLQVWEAREGLFLLQTRILMEQLLLALFEGEREPKPENRMASALEYIHRYYDRPIAAETLAGLCGLSVSHFRRLFLEETGKTPLQYREELRIFWAKRLLKSGILTVTEIAARLGYCDVYHFSKDFRRHTGRSPTAYKK